MSVKFIKDAVTVTLSDPITPVAPERPPRQRITYSGGGSIRVADLGSPDTVLKPSFTRILNADALALISFIENTVNYGALTFTFVSWAGVTYSNARYIDGRDSWKMGRAGRWDGQLEIRVDLGA